MSFWRRYRPARAVKPASPFRPRLEGLEDRCVPTVTVTNFNDPSSPMAGDGSLRGEIMAAGFGDTIQFAPSLKGQTITLKQTLAVTKSLTIDGANNGITVNGNGHQVFTIQAGIAVALNGLTITGGVTTADGGGIANSGSLTLTNSTVTGNGAGSGGGGGGIENLSGASMTMSGDTVNNNSSSADGGGIDNNGTLTVINCTIAANGATHFGGGISNFGVLMMANSTVAFNTVKGAGADGGGIYNGGVELDLLNTIVFNPNSGAATANDVFGTINQAQGDLFGSGVAGQVASNLGSNQFSKDPLLGPLQNNGGPTATMALLPGSPAIGHGVSTSSILGLVVPTTDQRGDPRPAYCTDIGAFQTQLVSPPPGQVLDVTALLSISRGKLRHNGSRFRQTITLSNAGAPIQGPLFLVVDGLTRKVRLLHRAGRTLHAAPLGSPFVLVSLNNNVLGTGETRTVVLTFDNPLGRKIHFGLRVLDGSGQP
jgi:hypothetical protein